MTQSNKPAAGMPEEWKPIIELPHKYHVSSRGRIKNILSNRIVAQRMMHKGYMTAMLYDGNKQYHRRVHRLMAEAFFGVCDGKVVNHLDGDRANNILTNLEYVSQMENVSHGKSINGLVGATFFKPKKKWQSRITVGGKRKLLGYFDTQKQANEAYKVALITYGLENKYAG